MLYQWRLRLLRPPCAFSLGCDKFAHDTAVLIVQMADRFIQEIKSNGWQSARIKATRCCCPKDSLPAFTFILSAIPSCSKNDENFLFFFASGKVVLQLYVFESGQFGEDAQVLKKHTQ